MVVVTSLETLLLLLGLGGTPPFLPLPEGKPWTATTIGGGWRIVTRCGGERGMILGRG